MPLWIVELMTSYEDNEGQVHNYGDREGYLTTDEVEVEAETEEEARERALKVAMPGLLITRVEKLEDE